MCFDLPCFGLFFPSHMIVAYSGINRSIGKSSWPSLFFIFEVMEENKVHQASQDTQMQNLFHSSYKTFLCTEKTNKTNCNLEIFRLYR